MMDTTLELKNKILQYVNSADDRLLRIINSIFENYYQEENDEIVGYDVKRNPITKSQYIERIKQAEKDIEAGNFTTHEDLLKEMKNW
ncbi:MAG TPA: hypothetical protein VKY36_01450 [Moheibacter sp.]|nr:hypothetical protein [Moheibacter sp.]